MDREQGAQIAWDAYRTHWPDQTITTAEVWRRVFNAVAAALAQEHAAEVARLREELVWWVDAYVSDMDGKGYSDRIPMTRKLIADSHQPAAPRPGEGE